MDSIYFSQIILRVKNSLERFLATDSKATTEYNRFTTRLSNEWQQLAAIRSMPPKEDYSCNDAKKLIKQLEELRSLISLELHQQHSPDINRLLRSMDLTMAHQILALARIIFMEHHDNKAENDKVIASEEIANFEQDFASIQANTATRHNDTRDSENINKAVNFVWFGSFPEKYVANIRSFVVHRNDFKIQLWVDNPFAVQKAFLDNQTVLKHIEIRHVNEIFDLSSHRWSKLSVHALSEIDPQFLTPEEVEIKENLLILNALDFDWKKLLIYAQRELVGLFNPAAASDIFRCFILLLKGGFYSDTDLSATQKLTLPVAKYGFLMMPEPDVKTGFVLDAANNGLLGSLKNHKFVILTMKRILSQYQHIEKKPIYTHVLQMETVGGENKYFFEFDTVSGKERKALKELAESLNHHVQFSISSCNRIYVEPKSQTVLNGAYCYAIEETIKTHPVYSKFLQTDLAGNMYFDLNIYSEPALTNIAKIIAKDLYAPALVRLEVDKKAGRILVRQALLNPEHELDKFVKVFEENGLFYKNAANGMLTFYQMDAKRKLTGQTRRTLTLETSGPGIFNQICDIYFEQYPELYENYQDLFFDYEIPSSTGETSDVPVTTTANIGFGGIIRACDLTWLRNSSINGLFSNAKAAEVEFPKVVEMRCCL